MKLAIKNMTQILCSCFSENVEICIHQIFVPSNLKSGEIYVHFTEYDLFLNVENKFRRNDVGGQNSENFIRRTLRPLQYLLLPKPPR